MKPVGFKYANQELVGPEEAEYSENVEGVDPLPIWTDGEQCVSCWKLSFKERLAALVFGRVWLAVLSGRTQPPVYVEASRTYLETPPRCYWRGSSLLGIFNSICGCLFNRVLVRERSLGTGKIIRSYWGVADHYPPEDPA